MSSKKSRLDLLVRVRYLNPLPPPPFPPKLFDIPTDIRRLGEPSYLSQLSTSAPLPMLVDAEMGMPLDLNQFDGVWDGDDRALNPTQAPAEPDPEDAILLAPAVSDDVKPTGTDVSWMRSGNLFMRKNATKRREVVEAARHDEVDASETAQVMAIDKSFADVQQEKQHPTRKELRVVETYDILPDADAWSNQYHILRFPERPTNIVTALAAAEPVSAERLNAALLYPREEEDGTEVIDYHLPGEGAGSINDIQVVDAETEARVRELAQEGRNDEVAEALPHVAYHRARVYEIVSWQKQVPKEVLITLRAGGARYKPINHKAIVRKMRAKRRDEMESMNSWDKVHVGRRHTTADERQVSQAEGAMVQDPSWHAQDIEMGEAIEEDNE